MPPMASHGVVQASQHGRLEAKVSHKSKFFGGDALPPVRPPAQHMIDSLGFQVVVNLAIVLNACQMGVAADFATDDWEATWNNFEMFFAVFFFLEMAVKLLALHLAYFRMDGVIQVWNLFDFFIVWSSVVDIVSQIGSSSDDDGGGLASMIGLLRLLRLLRMMKLLRVIPQFRILFDGILSALHSMFWVGALCLFLLYMVGVASVTLLGRSDAGYTGFSDDADVIISKYANEFNNYQYFGTVRRSMYSLFGICVMAELETILRPLWETTPVVCILLVLLAFVMMFGVLNILVGMIMDNVMKTVKEMDSEADKREQFKRAAFTEELAETLYEIDADHDGEVTTREFKSDAQGTRVTHLAHELDLPHGISLDDVFILVDANEDGCLTKDEFSDGMFRIVMNNEFQRSVMVEFRIAEVKRELRSIRQDFTDQIRDLKDSFIREIQGPRAPETAVEPKSATVPAIAEPESMLANNCGAEVSVELTPRKFEEKTQTVRESTRDSADQKTLTTDIMRKLVGECERMEDLWHQTQEERSMVQAERRMVEQERQLVEVQAEKMRADHETYERQMNLLRDESAKTLESVKSLTGSTPRAPDGMPPAQPDDDDAIGAVRDNLLSAAQDQRMGAVPLPRAPDSSRSVSLPNDTPRSCGQVNVPFTSLSCGVRDRTGRRTLSRPTSTANI